jgi:hypothetical protein
MVEFAYFDFWQEYGWNTLFILNTRQHPMAPINGINMCLVFVAKNFVEHLSNVIGQAKRH